MGLEGVVCFNKQESKMSRLQERKSYLQLWSFTTGPAIDVMKHYFEVKVLNTSSFESFLNDINNMHKLFHQCFPTTSCCYCATASLAAPKKKGCINLSQFDKLYDNSCLPQPSHEIMKGYKIDQICLCKYSAKSSVTVNDLDITLFNDIVQHCCSSKINFVWRKSIKDVRNFLAHAGTGYVNKQDFDDNWKTLNTATLGFAGEIGKVCEKMFQTEIVRIQSCSTEELKDMLENSTENQAKMLNLLNGIKPIVDECKKTAELVHMKQESHDQQFENLQSVVGQSSREIGEIKHKMNNFESFMKLMLDEKEKCTCDGSKRIKIETQVDNPCWNDENTTKRLCEMLNANVDEKDANKEKFYMKNVENKCIQIELVAFPDVFKSPQSLRKAIKILINQLIDAGEVDTRLPGRMDIEFTIKSPLTEDEMAVAYLVFGGNDNLDDSAENERDFKTKLQDHISVLKTLTLDTKTSDNLDSEMKFKPSDERFVLVKPETTPSRYEEFFITVENVRCLLKFTGLPENAEVPDGMEHTLDNKGNRKFYVELTLECPDSWNAEDVVFHMYSNLSKLHGYFHIDFLEQPLDRNITIQTTVEENVLLSETSLESAFQQLISKIRNVCNLQSTIYEELSVSATVLSVCDQIDEKKSVKEEVEKMSIACKDNNIRCQFCTQIFECYKCTAKEERIRILSRANRMKEQTISRLFKMSSRTEKEIRTGASKEGPEQKKRKTVETRNLQSTDGIFYENISKKCNYCQTEEASQILCHCNDCFTFICDNCVIEHRMKNRNHCYLYPSETLREYKLTHLWKPSCKEIIDMTFMAAGVVAILQQDKLSTYNMVGKMMKVLNIGPVFDWNCRIACLNDSKIAVTVPCNNLIEVVNTIGPTKTALGTPEGTNMTGGITCRMDILYVAFSDAMRLMDISGQIQKVIKIPSVNILHFVTNNKMLCVYPKNHSGKTMSCLYFNDGKCFDFDRFPFDPENLTTDEFGNIIFVEDGIIWQGDSDGKNIRMVMSPERQNWYEKITYNKDSKTLLTYRDGYNSGVRVYRKLD